MMYFFYVWICCVQSQSLCNEIMYTNEEQSLVGIVFSNTHIYAHKEWLKCIGLRPIYSSMLFVLCLWLFRYLEHLELLVFPSIFEFLHTHTPSCTNVIILLMIEKKIKKNKFSQNTIKSNQTKKKTNISFSCVRWFFLDYSGLQHRRILSF